MKTIPLLISLLSAAAILPAHAHGDKKHVPPEETVAEQTAWGIAGITAQATRTIMIDMTDNMRFTPDKITVNEGDTVRFVVNNNGRMLHEMVIGTAEELKAHAAMMAKYPNMEHDESWMVHVDPGKRGEIIWNFNRPGAFEFACLILGHYEAGMRGTITVTPKQGASK